MKNNFIDLNEKQNSQKMNQFSYNYFFHYLLCQSVKVRLFPCRYQSGDNSITSTEIINREIYGIYYVKLKDNFEYYIYKRQDIKKQLYDHNEICLTKMHQLTNKERTIYVIS